MRYREYPPSPKLSGIVDRLWFLEAAGPTPPEPIMPDGRVEIILHFGEPFTRRYPDGRLERQGALFVVGQMLAPICVGPTGHAAVAGIRLRPAATRAVICCSAGEITGRTVELEAIFGAAGSLRERLALAPDDTERVALLERWLASRVRMAATRDVDAAVQAIEATGGSADLISVAVHAGIGLRQLERRFLADVGLTPKAFARLVRLQAALRTISGGRTLADAAIACGYYDQAHMSRDFNRLAETSPGAWRQYSASLSPLFVSSGEGAAKTFSTQT